MLAQLDAESIVLIAMKRTLVKAPQRLTSHDRDQGQG